MLQYTEQYVLHFLIYNKWYHTYKFMKYLYNIHEA